jgi:hypothetical protein
MYNTHKWGFHLPLNIKSNMQYLDQMCYIITLIVVHCNTWLHFLSLTLTRGVSHCDLAIYTKKYLYAKENLWKLKYFTMQNIILKKSFKRNQSPSKYYNSN